MTIFVQTARNTLLILPGNFLYMFRLIYNISLKEALKDYEHDAIAIVNSHLGIHNGWNHENKSTYSWYFKQFIKTDSSTYWKRFDSTTVYEPGTNRLITITFYTSTFEKFE